MGKRDIQGVSKKEHLRIFRKVWVIFLKTVFYQSYSKKVTGLSIFEKLNIAARVV